MSLTLDLFIKRFAQDQLLKNLMLSPPLHWEDTHGGGGCVHGARPSEVSSFDIQQQITEPTHPARHFIISADLFSLVCETVPFCPLTTKASPSYLRSTTTSDFQLLAKIMRRRGMCRAVGTFSASGCVEPNLTGSLHVQTVQLQGPVALSKVFSITSRPVDSSEWMQMNGGCG